MDLSPNPNQIPTGPTPSVVPNPAPNPPAEPTPPATEPAPEPGGGALSGILSGLKVIFNWLIIPLGLVLILHYFVFQAFHVVGHSMDPTLNETDYLIVSKVDASIARLTHPGDKNGAYIPKREQIVIFKFPLRPSIVFVKRVIGLPGDHVVIQNGTVTVYNSANPNGFNPDSSHLTTDPVTLGSIDEVVPSGNIFVLGDNRTPGGSYDSRDWGLLPSTDIIGIATLRLLPLNQFKVLSSLVPAF